MSPEWSDLRVFLAVARAGTLAGAARAVGQTQPTIGRRLRALEDALGQRLFQRTPEGFVLTDEGAVVLEHAERIEAETLAFQRKLEGHEEQLQGRLRLSSPEWFGTHVLAPILAEYAARHPQVQLELITDSRLFSLSRREADLAFRITRFEDPEVSSRRLLHIHYGLYGQAGLAGAHLGDGTGVRLITMDTALSKLSDVVWLSRRLPQAQVVFRSNNREVHAQMCARGVGLAVLPRVMGDHNASLTRLDIGDAPPGKDMFVGYHRDLRKLPRLRALLDLAVEAVCE